MKRIVRAARGCHDFGVRGTPYACPWNFSSQFFMGLRPTRKT
jgi:hypothetical protein